MLLNLPLFLWHGLYFYEYQCTVRDTAVLILTLRISYNRLLDIKIKSPGVCIWEIQRNKYILLSHRNLPKSINSGVYKLIPTFKLFQWSCWNTCLCILGWADAPTIICESRAAASTNQTLKFYRGKHQWQSHLPSASGLKLLQSSATCTGINKNTVFNSSKTLP